MQRGKHRSIMFSPPSAQNETEQSPPVSPPPVAEQVPHVTLYEEPVDGVLVLGEMMRDAQLIEEKLKALPFAGGAGYRGELRVILGAANRLCQRCAKLLGEEKP